MINRLIIFYELYKLFLDNYDKVEYKVVCNKLTYKNIYKENEIYIQGSTEDNYFSFLDHNLSFIERKMFMKLFKKIATKKTRIAY